MRRPLSQSSRIFFPKAQSATKYNVIYFKRCLSSQDLIKNVNPPLKIEFSTPLCQEGNKFSPATVQSAFNHPPPPPLPFAEKNKQARQRRIKLRLLITQSPRPPLHRKAETRRLSVSRHPPALYHSRKRAPIFCLIRQFPSAVHVQRTPPTRPFQTTPAHREKVRQCIRAYL